MTQKILSMIGMLVLAGCSAQASNLSSDDPLLCSMAFASASGEVQRSDAAAARELMARGLLVHGADKVKRLPASQEDEVLRDFHARPHSRAKLVEECSAIQDKAPGFGRRLTLAKEEWALREGLGQRAVAAPDGRCAVALALTQVMMNKQRHPQAAKLANEFRARISYEMAPVPDRQKASWQASGSKIVEDLAKQPEELGKLFERCVAAQDGDAEFMKELPKRIRIAEISQLRTRWASSN